MARPSGAQPAAAALERSADPPQSNLPAELTSFIGRAAELGRVRELLGEARLLTLVGAGGCGKTRLALQAAGGARECFEDGVWWVELAAVEDPTLLATTVASALGLGERPGRPSLDVLLDHLRKRRALLVLDNCEHLLPACATMVDTLLRACPEVVVLATTREPLAVPGELPYRVPSLDVPAEPASLAEVMHSDAATLFADRAAKARQGFAVSEDNAPSVAAICRELDGLPLAIELAAARVRMLSPERIAEELGDRFGLLTDGGRTVAPRHETLRASIDWSYELCSEDECVMLRRLSVWVGGFTLDGARAVSGGEGPSGRAVLHLLGGLVDKSLVDTEEREGDIRYSMLETIRQYAAERLAEAGEVEVVRARHLAWCLELAERAEPELVRHDARIWLSRLEAEAANLRAALDGAMSHDVGAALRLAAALTFFWMRGRLEEGNTALARVLETASVPSATRGKARWGLAYLNIWRHQFEASSAYAEGARQDGEATDDRSVVARALTVQGQVRAVTNPLRGRPALERSVEIARDAGDEWCIAEATRLLGSSYSRQSEHDLAQPILEEGYALARSLGPMSGWYFDHRARGDLEHGRVGAAREFAERAASAAAEDGELSRLGFATALLVECDVFEGLPAQGRARGEPCLELMRRAGIGSGLAWVENALALADVAEGSPEAALRRLQGTLPLIEAGPAYEQVTRARRGLAVTRLLLGDLDGALEETQLLLAHAEGARNEHVEAMAHHLLGRIALTRGAVIDAEKRLHEALAIAARRDFRLQMLSSLESLAHVAALTESPAEAARLLGAVHADRERSGTVRWPPEPELWTRLEEDVRAALAEDAFAMSWVEGLALSVEEAADYASRARGSRKRPARGWESLTPTELEVVRHATAGLTNPQIGERMFITRGTVKVHLSHIFAKLGISSRAELAAEATKRGIERPAPTDAGTR